MKRTKTERIIQKDKVDIYDTATYSATLKARYQELAGIVKNLDRIEESVKALKRSLKDDLKKLNRKQK